MGEAEGSACLDTRLPRLGEADVSKWLEARPPRTGEADASGGRKSTVDSLCVDVLETGGRGGGSVGAVRWMGGRDAVREAIWGMMTSTSAPSAWPPCWRMMLETRAFAMG